MTRSATGPRGLDLASWLARKIREGHLRGLPPFPAPGSGTVHQADPYARTLLVCLQETSAEPVDLERARDDARAFRSWVERGELTPLPPRLTPQSPRRPASPGA